MAVRSSISRSAAIMQSRDLKGAERASIAKGPLAHARGSLRAFLLHLATERGLAENSLFACRRDLEDTEDWLVQRGHTFLSASADDFRGYLQDQRRKGQATKTVARRVAALRVFLRFLI